MDKKAIKFPNMRLVLEFMIPLRMASLQNENTLRRAALLALGIAVVVVACWEISLRRQGLDISYDDGPPLWSHKRAQVYGPADETVVFIGSSRIKYDLDIPTWERLTGLRAVQLAIEGSCPRPCLEDLARDPAFRGRLVVDVTEGLFFSNAPDNLSLPEKNVRYFHDLTPAQCAGFPLNHLLESQFVFLDQEQLSLNARLNALEIPSRPGVFMMPIFPLDFGRTTFERQAYMTTKFERDTALQNRVIGIWDFFAAFGQGAPPMPEEERADILRSVKEAVDQIKTRGGEVVFVRTPSSGADYRARENKTFPRQEFWERLLKTTGCKGIHFEDYPATSGYICPENSHLKRSDAVHYTIALAEILQKEMNWQAIPDR